MFVHTGLSIATRHIADGSGRQALPVADRTASVDALRRDRRKRREVDRNKDAHVKWQNVDGDKMADFIACVCYRDAKQGSNGTEWNTQERLRGI